ncbi:hypothetical protein Selin_0437 [Desulfurispirillum indicum S5]|uniref:Lipoprotein LPP20-like domain-containing protein n=1 Tax=Desulfurispirillum indicum (strain ATCC BAA-1389 / DSM 22839 / S5) TaxID=653733 RepID=E6W064_DESIS|nr:LPP20 family lipoprotein [Desulfurispirillum indicum]ADU65190.1 hypothetical protein Selin_0437 [Desulfurispirillum indicum S5]
MRSLISALLALSLTLLLSACASRDTSAPTHPTWLTGESERFPASSYVLGRGSGPTPAIAADGARADLAKFFQVQVSSQVRTHVLERVEGTAAPQIQQQYEVEVNARVNRVLEGVEIGESWYDSQSGSYHALAVLHRGRTVLNLENQAADIDSRTRHHVEQATRRSDVLGAVSELQQAIELQRSRLPVEKMLQVLDRTGLSPVREYEINALQTRQRELLATRTIRVVATADQGADQLQAAASGALSTWGLRVVPEGDYTLNVTLQSATPVYQDRWYWVRASVDMVLSDADGNVLNRHSTPIRESAQQAATASRRALEQAIRATELHAMKLFVEAGQP